MDDESQTIRDFGKQWLHYRDINGFFGSLELFSDMIHPFLKPDDIKDCNVAEIGSGSGRIVNMLLLAICDQLSLFYAKYHTRSEAEKLLLDGKSENVQFHHRHGYSWTVIGTKPLT